MEQVDDQHAGDEIGWDLPLRGVAKSCRSRRQDRNHCSAYAGTLRLVGG